MTGPAATWLAAGLPEAVGQVNPRLDQPAVAWVVVLGIAAVTASVLLSVFAARRKRRIAGQHRIEWPEPPYPGFADDVRRVATFQAFAEAAKFDVIEARRHELDETIERLRTEKAHLAGPPPDGRDDAEDRLEMRQEVESLLARAEGVERLIAEEGP
jgi:hypothetical protein